MIDPKSWEGHTPGPWKNRGSFFVWSRNDGNGDLPVCACVRNFVSQETMHANAALIAAAPELAAEVERLRRRLAYAEKCLKEDDLTQR